MKSETEIRARLDELRADERLTYKPAELAARRRAEARSAMEALVLTLEWVLDWTLSRFPLKRAKR